MALSLALINPAISQLRSQFLCFITSVHAATARRSLRDKEKRTFEETREQTSELTFEPKLHHKSSSQGRNHCRHSCGKFTMNESSPSVATTAEESSHSHTNQTQANDAISSSAPVCHPQSELMAELNNEGGLRQV